MYHGIALKNLLLQLIPFSRALTVSDGSTVFLSCTGNAFEYSLLSADVYAIAT